MFPVLLLDSIIGPGTVIPEIKDEPYIQVKNCNYTIFLSTAYFIRAAVLGTCSLVMIFLR